MNSSKRGISFSQGMSFQIIEPNGEVVIQDIGHSMTKNIIESKQWEKDLLTVALASNSEFIAVVAPTYMGETKQAELIESKITN